MKTIFVLWAVVSVAAFANAHPTEGGENLFNSVLELMHDAPEQMKCIQDAWGKVQKENPKFDWWFKDVEQSVDVLKKEFADCKTSGKPMDVMKCYAKLAGKAKTEFKRWMESLPEEDKNVLFEQLKNDIKGCFNKFSALFGLAHNPEQLKCMQDAWTKVQKENPKFDWWFKDVEQSVDGLKKEAEDCKASDKPIEAMKCFATLAVKAKTELKRWMSSLPEEDKKVLLEQFKAAFKGCFHHFGAILEWSYNAPEQFKCVQDAWKKVANENPKLDWWFKDFEKFVDGVKKEFEDCKASDQPIDTLKCYFRMVFKAQKDFWSVVKSLPEEDRNSLFEQLKTAIQGCFNHFSTFLGFSHDAAEQLKCIQDAWHKLANKNPKFDLWFKDVEQSVDGLMKEAKTCKASDTPINAFKCYAGLVVKGKNELERWIKALPEEDRVDLIKKIKTAVEVCY